METQAFAVVITLAIDLLQRFSNTLLHLPSPSFQSPAGVTKNRQQGLYFPDPLVLRFSPFAFVVFLVFYSFFFPSLAILTSPMPEVRCRNSINRPPACTVLDNPFLLTSELGIHLPRSLLPHPITIHSASFGLVVSARSHVCHVR